MGEGVIVDGCICTIPAMPGLLPLDSVPYEWCSGSGPPHVTGIALLRRRNPRAMLRPRPYVLRTISLRFAPLLAHRNTDLRLLRFYPSTNYPLSHA